ncbi:MAG TPA: hypothetical protein VGS10_18470 [Terracidiphilus sp.]|nr:hypothetical protein [Terracidiphilus sp.]
MPASRHAIARHSPVVHQAPLFLELAKVLSFFLTLLALLEALNSAFFIPGASWQDRLAASLLRIGVAGCISFASGILFTMSARAQRFPVPTLLSTFPVRLFLWTLLGMAILFALSWYLDAWYVPLLWRNQP